MRRNFILFVIVFIVGCSDNNLEQMVQIAGITLLLPNDIELEDSSRVAGATKVQSLFSVQSDSRSYNISVLEFLEIKPDAEDEIKKRMLSGRTNCKSSSDNAHISGVNAEISYCVEGVYATRVAQLVFENKYLVVSQTVPINSNEEGLDEEFNSVIRTIRLP